MDGFYPPQEFAPEFGPYGDLEGECVQEFPTEYGPYVGNGGYHTSEAAYLESQMGATPREAPAQGEPTLFPFRLITDKDIEALNEAMDKHLRQLGRASNPGMEPSRVEPPPPPPPPLRTAKKDEAPKVARPTDEPLSGHDATLKVESLDTVLAAGQVATTPKNSRRDSPVKDTKKLSPGLFARRKVLIDDGKGNPREYTMYYIPTDGESGENVATLKPPAKLATKTIRVRVASSAFATGD
ncbi:MAG TPA: hypothetical protein VFK11_02050 [Candidatus Saccharimonadales bacterium]|nr:hypothetical protein [Candidatus Saccharimonadales bacterium]